MTSTRINELRLAVPTRILQLMPSLRACQAIFGRFNLDELETYSAKVPAAFFSVTEARPEVQAGGQFDLALTLAVFLLAEGKDRDSQAWAMAEAVALMLTPDCRWNLQNLTGPADIKVAPVLGAQIKAKGVAIAAVSWRQVLTRASLHAFASAGVLLDELYVNGDPVDLKALP